MRGWRPWLRRCRASASSRTARSPRATAGSSSPVREARPAVALRAEAEIVDCEGRWITPGLIDCHTHLVYAGDRANEFEMRLAGATYEEIARAGGGIVSSVKALRAASEDELVAQSLPRLDALIAEGVTTVEIKSGYGLDLENETQVAARRAPAGRGAAGQQSAPPSSARMRCRRKPTATRTPTSTASSTRCCRRSPRRAWPTRSTASARASPSRPSRSRASSRRRKALGLPVKLHADQLSNLHGAALAARFGALSADHLEYTDEAGAAAMAKAGTVAVLLPGAFYFIRETKKPPVDLFRRHGVPMAVATDCNPGTSPLTSLLLTMNMAATLFGMTVEECLAGVTREAARALGLLGRDRHAGGRQVGRPRHLGHRAPGRARLPHGLQPAASRASGGDNDRHSI